MNLLENTADFVSSQLSSGSTDPGVLQDVGASLLHGISNVISAASTGAQQDEEEKEELDESEESEKETEKEKKKAVKGQVLICIKMYSLTTRLLHVVKRNGKRNTRNRNLSLVWISGIHIYYIRASGQDDPNPVL